MLEMNPSPLWGGAEVGGDHHARRRLFLGGIQDRDDGEIAAPERKIIWNANHAIAESRSGSLLHAISRSNFGESVHSAIHLD